MHTATMMKTADFLAGLYADVIDRGLLLAGTFLHDFAKEREFTFSKLGLVTEYSVKGQLRTPRDGRTGSLCRSRRAWNF
jgi:3'-5' exoribonuclease